ncbi:NmrA/HSCARG family protein [Cystobacter fuscus]|uniref:NmrA/HSCARG family protein n=1 Tax=Cystobacter fuscus TaxID=43 RepID=UPI002B316E86|nr:NmrA/HSCARG family protein [Cystobacter fuscus]
MAEAKTILVLGATGQQGGATARALVRDGWRVRALVRDPASPRARALEGVELVAGDMGDAGALAAAMAGAYGVFSVQPSSGQPQYGVTDEEEERLGIAVADAAGRAGVAHLVYTSVAWLGPDTGVGHFESKWRIEEHIRRSRLPATIVRPAGFMEMLLEPHLGLTQGRLQFFMRPEQPIQLIAVADIGRLVARVFADPARHLGQTLELAGDELTGPAIASLFGRARGIEASYARFPAEVLAANDMMRRLSDFADRGGMSNGADMAALRQLVPDLLTFEAWLRQTA